MKKYIAIIFSLFLLNGCAPTVLTQTENSITLQREALDEDAHFIMKEANEYCAKKGKIPDLVLKDRRTYKFECVDK